MKRGGTKRHVVVMLSEALQRNAKHEARLSNISVYFCCHLRGQPSEILRFAQNDSKHYDVVPKCTIICYRSFSEL